MRRVPDPTPAEIHQGCEHAQHQWSAREELRRRTVGPYDTYSDTQTRVRYLPPVVLIQGVAHFRVAAVDE